VALAGIAVLSMAVMSSIEFPPVVVKKASDNTGRPLREIMRQPVFLLPPSLQHWAMA